MKIRVCIAGATGWAGAALSRGVIADNGLELVSGISRKSSGENLSEILRVKSHYIPVLSTVEEALSQVKCDVLVEFTHPEIAKHNVITALEKGVNVVIGTSGLTEEDYSEIEKIANKNKCSVLAVGNFAITVVLLQKFSEIAAKFIPNFEIIDYADQNKVDSPSGSAFELANRLSKIQPPVETVSEDRMVGPKDARGTKVNGVRVHSLRLPSYVISLESVFGLNDERLTIRHDLGAGAEPYVKGGILAIKKVNSFKGLKRGLDSVMDLTI